jgi:paraquat-inducible protein B
MADVDNPKTHVEDQVAKGDVELPRTQPESPKHEGIDPLTESDTLYPSEDTKAESERLAKSDDKAATEVAESDENSEEIQKTDQVAADQQEVDAKANTPNANLPDEDKTPTTDQVAKEEKAAADADKSADKPAAPADAKAATPAKPAESPSDGSGADASKAASK